MRKTLIYILLCITLLILPTLLLLWAEQYTALQMGLVSIIVACVYIFSYTLWKNPSWCTLWLSPLFIISGYQLVLLFLFRRSVISADMLLNFTSTSSNESNELMSSIWPLIFCAIVCYGTPILYALFHCKRKTQLSPRIRLSTGVCASILGTSTALFSLRATSADQYDGLRHTIYPINAVDQILLMNEKYNLISTYAQQRKSFEFQASRDSLAPEVILFILGEASRAANFGIYGYERNTTPLLKQRKDLFIFANATTECNMTAKIVPIILTSGSATNYINCFKEKGILAAYKEAGYEVVSVSNHISDGGIIDQLRQEGDVYIEVQDNSSKHPYDLQGTELLKSLIKKREKPLFILYHTYGSHFAYNQRYPDSLRIFGSDEYNLISNQTYAQMHNAYDNTIRQVDCLLNEMYEFLDQEKVVASVLYLSDHGEDLADDERELRLHCSPIPSYYQLHIPYILWMSKAYQAQFPGLKINALQNTQKPISSSSVFHTLIELGQLHTPVFDKTYSVVNENLISHKEQYLNIFDKGTSWEELGLHQNDWILLEQKGLLKHPTQANR